MSTPNIVVDIDALHQQFEVIKDAERKRNEFVEGLMRHIQDLSNERGETVKALRAKEMLASTYQDRFEATEKQIGDLRRAIDCDMFVLVLIDGDDTLFKDGYVKDGLPGGERAARDLQQALFDYLKSKQFFKHDHKIVTRIYLNLAGLSKTYNDTKTVSGSISFLQFVQGFNKTHSLMEIIDAGNGKEAADNKIKGKPAHPDTCS